MTPAEAVERSAHITAEACASVLGTLVGADASWEDVGVDVAPATAFDGLVFPLVEVRIAFVEGISGENVFVLKPSEARRLANAMMAMDDPGDDAAPLNEIELSAVSEAMNQMMGTVATAMAQATGRTTDIATPRTRLIGSREDVGEADAAYSAHFTLHAGALVAKIVQIVPETLAQTLLNVFHSAAVADQVLGGKHREAVGNLTNETFAAVERTARITAESSAEVLSTLMGTRVSATLPEIEAEPDDPLGRLTYPLVTVEVSYVSGVNGANLFVLTPAQSAMLAAVMMGLDAPTGDGLSELERSAVSEAMNQMMGAATNILADTLSLDIEVAPPVCQIMETVEEARATFGEAAYCSRFRIVSDRLTADVVQLVPFDFAMHLQAAFAAADIGRSVVAEPMPAKSASSDAFSPAAENARANRTAPGNLDLGGLRGVRVRLSAELGRASVEIARVANMPPGAIIELDREPDDPIDVLVNGRPYAQARLVLVDGEYAVQILSLTPPQLLAA